MNSATVELKTLAVTWREQKNRISLFFVKSVALFSVFMIVVIVAWKLCVSKGENEGTTQTLKDLAVLRQARSIRKTAGSYERTVRKDSISSTKEAIADTNFLLESIDPNINPCDNFYNFTCNNQGNISEMEKLQDTITRVIHGLVKDPINDNDSMYVKLQKKYYQACMNVTAIEEDNNETFKRKLGMVGKWPVFDGDQWTENEFDWGKTMENCRNEGLYFDVLLTVGGCKIVDSTDGSISYVLEVSPPFRVYKVEDHLKQQYVELIAKIVKLLGAPGNLSTIYESMTKVMYFEIELANITEGVPSDDSHFNKSMTGIERDYSFIPWQSFLRDAKMGNKTKILFNADTNFYLNKLKDLLGRTSKRDLANYMLWKAIESIAQYLTSDVRKEFVLYANLSNRYRFPADRESFCHRSTNFIFSYVSEAEYVTKYETERRAVENMVNRMVTVLRRIIGNSSWVDESEKKKAQSKLESIELVIGGPSEMYDIPRFAKLMGYDTFNISHLHNVLEIVCEVDRKRAVYGVDFLRSQPNTYQENIYKAVPRIDRIEYITSSNKLVVPTATFNGILFSINRPNYLNYGALGTKIGHQLAHVLDEKGYKRRGNRVASVNVVAECLLSKCNDIGVENRFPASCSDTLDENLADYVGVNIAHEAYRELQQEAGEEEKALPESKYTQAQFFWISHASAICGNSKNSRSFRHMLPFQRVMGTLRNCDRFAEDFQCPSGSIMNPREKCEME